MHGIHSVDVRIFLKKVVCEKPIRPHGLPLLRCVNFADSLNKSLAVSFNCFLSKTRHTFTHLVLTRERSRVKLPDGVRITS